MTSTRSLNRLVGDVDDLLAQLHDEHSPEIEELRSRVAATSMAAKRAIAAQRSSVARRIGRYAGSLDDYITDFPRLGFLTGILVGGMLRYVRGLASSRG